MRFMTIPEFVEVFQYGIDETPKWAEDELVAMKSSINTGMYVVKKENGIFYYEPKMFREKFQEVW